MEENLKEKTGKTLQEWKVLLASKPFEKHGEYMTFLKKDCGITHGFANFITLKYRESDAGSADPSDLIRNQYQGKEALKAIFDLLDKHISAMGNNIDVVPKKAAVSYRVKRQFALIQASTKTRIDLGLKLSDEPCQGKLEGSGPFGSMCTHRIKLMSTADVDHEVLGWLQKAYIQAGGES